LYFYIRQTDYNSWNYYYEEDYPQPEYFNPDIECDKRVPFDHPNPKVAGHVPYGGNCWLKCREGFKFTRYTDGYDKDAVF